MNTYLKVGALGVMFALAGCTDDSADDRRERNARAVNSPVVPATDPAMSPTPPEVVPVAVPVPGPPGPPGPPGEPVPMAVPQATTTTTTVVMPAPAPAMAPEEAPATDINMSPASEQVDPNKTQ